MQGRLVLCAALLTGWGFSQGAQAGDAASDRQALVAFRNSLANRACLVGGWPDSAPTCSWAGITCNNASRVVSIQLANDAPTPAQASSNASSAAPQLNVTQPCAGRLPGSWDQLDRLRLMDLSDNALSGSVPASWTGSDVLPSLRTVDLSDNQLAGDLPVRLGNGSRLISLALGGNGFVGTLVASWAATMPSLQFLNLTGTSVSGSLPSDWATSGAWLGAALYLQSMNLAGPLPPSWAQAQWGQLWALDNRLNGTLPPEWGTNGSWANLLLLALDGNQLSGSIPAAWANPAAFPSLQALSLRANEVTGALPPRIGKSSSLTSIDLAKNNFKGTLPRRWGLIFPNVTDLTVATNKLTGQLPSDWGPANDTVPWPRLERMFLLNNSLNGSIPASWSNRTAFPALQRMSLTNNFLSGQLPVSFGGAENLFSMQLDNNTFDGTLPAQWVTTLRSMGTISIAFNTLTGTLPPEWAAWTSLYELLVGANQLNGTIPQAWAAEGAMPAMTDLDVSTNPLTGTLPAVWSNNATFVFLGISSTMINGTLPSTWGSPGSWPALTSMVLYNNSLFGQLPPSWGSPGAFPQVQYAVISYNGLSGTLPPQWAQPGAWPALQFLGLDQNYLSDLPDNWGHGFPNVSAILLHGNSGIGRGAPGSWTRTFCVREGDVLISLHTPQPYNASAPRPAELTELTAKPIPLDSYLLNHGGRPPQFFTGPSIVDAAMLYVSFTDRSYNVCQNPHAVAIVSALCSAWVAAAALALVAVAAYWRARDLSLPTERGHSKGQQADKQQRHRIWCCGAVVAAVGAREVALREQLHRVRLHHPRLVQAAVLLFRAAVDLALPVLETVFEIILIARVLPGWPGWALLGALLGQYAIAGAILAVHLLRSGWRGLAQLPALPLLVVALDPIMMADRLGLHWRWANAHLVNMDAYYDMRNVVKAASHSTPSIVIASVAYLLGNRSSVRFYLTDQLYLERVLLGMLFVLKTVAYLAYGAHKRGLRLLPHAWSLLIHDLAKAPDGSVITPKLPSPVVALRPFGAGIAAISMSVGKRFGRASNSGDSSTLAHTSSGSGSGSNRPDGAAAAGTRKLLPGNSPLASQPAAITELAVVKEDPAEHSLAVLQGNLQPPQGAAADAA